MENEQNTPVENDKPSHLWPKGVSGNPSGRPKKSEEEKQLATELMSGIKNLGPMTLAAIEKILNPDNKVQAMARVKMIEIILSYIVGKPSSEIKLSVSTEEMAEASEIRIAALVQAVRQGGNLSAGYEAITEESANSDESNDMITIEGEGNVEH